MRKKTEQYNPEKIDLIKRHLERQRDMQQTLFYEIYVDTFKAVPKTSDISFFDSYEMYINDDAERMKILIYQGNSHRYDTFEFYLQENLLPIPANNAMNGLGAVQETVDERIRQAMQERDMQDYLKEMDRLKEELEDAEDYIEKLQVQVQKLEAEVQELNNEERAFMRKNYILGHLLNHGSALLKRNPQILQGIPLLGETLAQDFYLQGLEEQQQRMAEAQYKQKTSEETQASFTPKQTTTENTQPNNQP